MTQTKTQITKQSAKVQHNSTPAYPSFITQVNKDDGKKSTISEFFNFSKCCSFLWKCLPSKKQNHSVINDSVATTASLLEPQHPRFKGKKTLVLDLDETLVHSTFEPVANPDLVLPVKIQNTTYKINVIIRPGTEEFLARVGELYEVVVFTASLAEYAEPLVKILDTTNAVSSLLFRQHCTPLNGIYVKDMTLLGRDLKDIILVDNSPNSFLFQPENAYHIKNFFDDKTDRDLDILLNFLEEVAEIDDVRPIEQLRVKIEQQPSQQQKTNKFVKVKQQEEADLELSSIQVQEATTMASPAVRDRESYKDTINDRERSYNIETEPDLKKDEREEEFSANSAKSARLDQKYTSFAGRVAPLTERIQNDRLLELGLDSSVYLELPSPKESDGLINHRDAEPSFNGNSENEAEKKKGQTNKAKVPSLAVSGANVFNKAYTKPKMVTVDNKVIEGHKVEDVRMLTGLGNMNSPLGRQIKIEFDKSKIAVKN